MRVILYLFFIILLSLPALAIYEIPIEGVLTSPTGSLLSSGNITYYLRNSTRDIVFNETYNLSLDANSRYFIRLNTTYDFHDQVNISWAVNNGNESNGTFIGYAPYAIYAEYLGGHNWHDVLDQIFQSNRTVTDYIAANYVNISQLQNETIIRAGNTSWIKDNQNYNSSTDIRKAINSSTEDYESNSLFGNFLGSVTRWWDLLWVRNIHSVDINTSSINSTLIYKNGQELDNRYLQSFTESDPNSLHLDGSNANQNIDLGLFGFTASFLESPQFICRGCTPSSLVMTDGDQNLLSATAGVDYLTPTSDGSSLSGVLHYLPNYNNTIYLQKGQSINTTIWSINSPTSNNPYTIIIPSGVYNEKITLRDYVNIKGNGKNTILNESNLYIANVELSDLTIINSQVCLGSGAYQQNKTIYINDVHFDCGTDIIYDSTFNNTYHVNNFDATLYYDGFVFLGSNLSKMYIKDGNLWHKPGNFVTECSFRIAQNLDPNVYNEMWIDNVYLNGQMLSATDYASFYADNGYLKVTNSFAEVSSTTVTTYGVRCVGTAKCDIYNTEIKNVASGTKWDLRQGNTANLSVYNSVFNFSKTYGTIKYPEDKFSVLNTTTIYSNLYCNSSSLGQQCKDLSQWGSSPDLSPYLKNTTDANLNNLNITGITYHATDKEDCFGSNCEIKIVYNSTLGGLCIGC